MTGAFGGERAGAAGRRFRRLQVALGLLWIVDGLLQLQPANASAAFAGAITDNAMGQPAWVQSMVVWVASSFADHPLAGDIGLASVQIALGLAIVAPRTRRWGLAASIPWAIGVWVLGEALGNLATGFAMLPSGGPGPALLYALAAVVTLARSNDAPASRPRDAVGLASTAAPAARLGVLGERGTAVAWGVLWCGAALLQAIPVGTLGFKLSANLQMSSLGEPGIVAGMDRAVARFTAGHGPAVTAVLIVLELATAAGALARGRARAWLLRLGFVACLAFWLVGENCGALLSGTAVDVGSMPLYVLLGVALLPAEPRLLESRPHAVLADSGTPAIGSPAVPSCT